MRVKTVNPRYPPYFLVGSTHKDEQCIDKKLLTHFVYYDKSDLIGLAPHFAFTPD